ncbi:unnamed protein product [Cuscuta epithymum]|uniref:RING-type E3 ubiquitin transferase n=1 Tax=Cuscuta epithymum TaxID=186058 RepID=A0AAV0CGA8_9ASTE|nr:unnamed protein product [Cuscuta epithymum]
MDSAAVFSSLRRRRSPSLEAFLAPLDLEDRALVKAVAALAKELISSFPGKVEPAYQRKNSKILLRKIRILSVAMEWLGDNRGSSRYPSNAFMCFKELYLILYRSKILLDYCVHSSKLWLLLQNHSISGHFLDLNQEISTLLDVLPIQCLNLPDDVREQVTLLQKQSKKSILFIDKQDELLRLKLYSFLNEFEKGKIPDSRELYSLYVEKLEIRDARSCRFEIEFLEEQVMNHEGDIDPTASVLSGFVAMTRYSSFLLFGFEEEHDDEELGGSHSKHYYYSLGSISQEIRPETFGFSSAPKDFCCPISLDLMKDPVIIVSTGQTYDRPSILRWMEEGHCNCPKTGQTLVHTHLVPNRALKNLITQWCAAHRIPYDNPPETGESCSGEGFGAVSPGRATYEANKATAAHLIKQLGEGTQKAKTIAAREIRLLAKTGKENRAYIAEAGAILLLKNLLSSPDSVAQENSVTAILNLSIHEKNKERIMGEKGCLELIVGVLRSGHTPEARENAAATLFSLSAVHDYKKIIAREEGAVEALVGLLREGSPRGKKDAVTALFNLSTHTENCGRMIDSGAVSSLVMALGTEGVSEEAAGALTLIVRQPAGAAAVGREEHAVSGLIGMMRCGSPKGKENAVVALLELCRGGGDVAAERMLRAPALARSLQSLLFTGTKRARRKAASLARVFQRCEQHGSTARMMHYGGGYAFGGGTNSDRDTSFVATDVSVTISISVI